VAIDNPIIATAPSSVAIPTAIIKTAQAGSSPKKGTSSSGIMTMPHAAQ